MRQTHSHQINLLKYAYFFHVHSMDSQDRSQANQHISHELLLEKVWNTRERISTDFMGKVCKPKAQGGLGVLDVHLHNQALLMKFLHKFFNKENTPWVKIIWEAYYQDSLPGDSW